MPSLRYLTACLFFQTCHLSPFPGLSQLVCRNIVHVVKFLVLSAHRPDERVVAGSRARMNGPGRRNHRLLVPHDDVPGLLSLSHHVEHHLVLRHLEIHVDFHSALMGVGRHRVPHAARLQHGHAHGKLAGLQHVGMDELVDDALVGGLH